MKTSITDPIRVDWLPTPWPGRVGLTFAPGKKHRSAFGDEWNRDLAIDLHRLSDEYRASRLVTLLENHELERLCIPELVLMANDHGVTVRRLPIRDGEFPDDDRAVGELVSQIVDWASSGERIVIHCRGGLGRAGTIGGCVLKASGLSDTEALEALSAARGAGCPETREQRDYIRRFQPA